MGMDFTVFTGKIQVKLLFLYSNILYYSIPEFMENVEGNLINFIMHYVSAICHKFLFSTRSREKFPLSWI